MTFFLAVVLIGVGFALGLRTGRRESATPPSLDAACLAAARAYCVDRFDYEGPYSVGTPVREVRIEVDAAEVAERPWFRAVVKAALEVEGRA
ncbi:hypothetical protein [Frankia sp. AgW1.1]|uniref:hypothetical protein n=1 Tax=Frankia sp. AgW1.1 TaxID=1836971 RepID=UPI001932BC0E|nr:hypothetical protein [Frankia sp. AgW1.1]MBL7487121.1 hypothetical protein [Frankia sp. AgW1.1]